MGKAPVFDFRIPAGVNASRYRDWLEVNAIGYAEGWYEMFKKDYSKDWARLQVTYSQLPGSGDDKSDDGQSWNWLYETFFVNNPIEKVLDVGSGVGLFSIALARVKRYRVTGMECSHLLVGLCRGIKDMINTPNVEFEYGDALMMPFPENSFDVVFSKHVLEHLQSPLLALTEQKRVGRIVCGFVPLEEASDNKEHLYNFKPEDLENYMKRLFKRYEVKVFGKLIAYGGYKV